MKAVCITGEYKSLELGKVYEIETLRTNGIRVVGGAREYERNLFAFVDDNGKPIVNKYALGVWRREKNG